MEEDYPAIDLPPGTMYGHMPQTDPGFHQNGQHLFNQHAGQHFQQRGPPPPQMLSQGLPDMLGPHMGIEHCSNQRPLLSPPGVVYMNTPASHMRMPGLPPHLQTSLHQQVPMLPSPQMIPLSPEMMPAHYPQGFPQVLNRETPQRGPMNVISELEKNTRRRMAELRESTGSYSPHEQVQQVNEQQLELNQNMGFQIQQEHQNSIQRNMLESEHMLDPNFTIHGMPHMVSSMRRLSAEEIHRKIPPQQFLRSVPQGMDIRPYPLSRPHQYPQNHELRKAFDPLHGILNGNNINSRLPKPPPLKQGIPASYPKDSATETLMSNKESECQGNPCHESSERSSTGIWPPLLLPDVVQTLSDTNTPLPSNGKPVEVFQSENSEQVNSHQTIENSVDTCTYSQVDKTHKIRNNVIEFDSSTENPTKMYAPSPSHLDTSPNATRKHIPDNKPKTTVSDRINNDIDGVHHPMGAKDNNECNLHKDQIQGSHEYEHESSKPTGNDGVSNEHDDNNIIHKTDSKSINGESNAKYPSIPSILKEADDLLMDETPEAQNTVAECSASVSNATIDDIGEQSNQQLDSVENDDKMSQPVDKSEQNNEKQSESPVSMKEDDVNKNNADGSKKENYIYLNIKVDGKLDKSKYFECIPCTYKTPSKHKYDEHMEAHIHRKYVCKFCDKVFIKSSDVQRHEPLHSQHHKSPIKRFHNQHRNTENVDSDNDDPHEMPNMALTQTFKKSVPDNVPINDPHMDTDDAVGNSEAGADNSDAIIENDHNGDSEVNNEIALMRKQYLDSVKRPGDQGDDEMDIDEESINTLHSPQRTGGLWPGPGYTSTPSDGGPSEKSLSPRRSRVGLNHEDPSYRPSSVRNVNSEAIDGVRRSGRTRTLTSSSLMDSSIWASPDDPSLEIKAEPQYPNMPYDNSYIGESQDYYPGPENDWIGGPRKPHQGAWTYNCVRCKYKTNQKVRYDMHMQSHNGNYICPVCDKAMLYLSDFVRHVDTHEKYYYECPYYNDCKYNSTSLNSFEKHLRTIHPEHASECPTCGFKSNSTVRFFKHLETHSLTANEMLGVLCKSTNREVKHVPPLDIPDGPAVPVISSPASAVLTTSAISAPTSPLLIPASAMCQDTGQLSHNVSDISDFSPKIVSVAGSVTSDFSYIQPTNHVPIKHIPFSSPEHGNTSKKCMFVCMYCKHMFVSEQAIRYHVEKEHKTKLVMATGGSTVQSSIAMNKPRDPGGRFQTMRSMFDAQKPPSEKSYTCVKQVKTTTGQLLQVTVDKFGVPKSTVAFKCLLCNMIFVAKDNLKIHLEECKVKHGIQHGGKGYIATEESQSYSPESALKMSQNILYKEVQIIPKLVKKKQKQEQTDINDGLELTNNTARLETITKNKCIKTGHFKCKYQGDNTVELFANRNAIVMLKNKPEPKNNVVYKINVGGMTKLQGPGKENPKNSVPRTEINQVEETETVKESDSNDIEAATTTDDINKGESTGDENVSLEIPNQHNNEEIKMDVSVDNEIPKDPTENGVISNQLPTKNENVISEGELGAIQEYEDSKHKEADSQTDENTSESKNKNDHLLTMLGLIHKNKTQEKNDINESLPSTSSFTSISSSESNQTTGDLVDAMVTSADVMVTSSTSSANSTKLKMLSTEIPCRMCSYKTRSPECYEAHVLGHKAVKHEHSDAIFQSYSLVNVNNREMYECKLCPYRSKRLDKIEQHLFFHKTKQFMCNICDRAFIKRCDLERHMEVEMRNRMRGQGYVFNGARKTVQLAKRRASGYKRGKYRKHKSTPGSQTIKNESFTGYQPNNIPDHLMNI